MEKISREVEKSDFQFVLNLIGRSSNRKMIINSMERSKELERKRIAHIPRMEESENPRDSFHPF